MIDALHLSFWYACYLAAICLSLWAAPSDRWLTARRAPWLRGCALLLATAIVVAITDCPWFGDFESAYYPAGQAITSAPLTLYHANCSDGFTNLPIVALLFMPFGSMRYSTAVGMYTVVGLLAIAGAAVVALKRFARTAEQRWVVLALLAVNGPLWYSLREGNSTHVVLGGVLLALHQLERRRDVGAGVLLGLAATVKIPLLVFAPYFVWRRQWWVVSSFAATIVGLVGLSMVAYGPTVHELWLTRCLVPSTGGVISGFNVQSVDGFLARLYGADPFSWESTAMTGSFLVVRIAVVGCLVGLVALVLSRRPHARARTQETLDLSIAVLTGLLVFPVSWTHYYSFLLIPVMVLLTRTLDLPWGWRGAVCVATVAVSSPLLAVRGPSATMAFVFGRGLSSLHFLGGVMLLVILLRARTAAGTPAPRLSERPLGFPTA